MLSGVGLLGLGASTARRQGWTIVPLFVTMVLARLLGIVPSLFLAARFLRSGLRDTHDLRLAYLLGFFENLGNPGPWTVAAVGGLLAAAGGVLLFAVINAGLLRLFAAQAGQSTVVSDEKFAEGVLRAPQNYLTTAIFAEVLKFFAAGCCLGTLISGMAFFLAAPGALAALLMTVATGVVLLLPFMMASLDVGFARAVILEEAPWVAIAEGMALVWKRSSAMLPAWYTLVFVDLAVSIAIGTSGGAAGALPSQHHLWILKLGPVSVVWLMGIAAIAIVELWRLGVYAALVTEAAGTLPSPPPQHPPELVLRTVPLGPDEPVLRTSVVALPEPILVARAEEAPLVARAVDPEEEASRESAAPQAANDAPAAPKDEPPDEQGG
jgi:hypothetical protein